MDLNQTEEIFAHVNITADVLQFWGDMLPSRLHLFPGGLWLFQQDNARPHSARLLTARPHRRRVCVHDWPHLSPIENGWSITERRLRQQQPRTVEQMKSCIQKEWMQILR